jgi:hypothetical protein
MRFTLPSNYQSITIGMMQAYQIAKLRKKQDEMVAAVTELDVKEVRARMPITIYADIIKKFEDLLAEDKHIEKRFLNVKSSKGVFVRRTMLGMIPDFYTITANEDAELNNYLTNYWDNLHKIAGVFFRPVTKKVGKYYEIMPYDSDKAKQFHDCLKDVPLIYFNGALAFFLRIRKQLERSSQVSFQNQVAKNLQDLTTELREERLNH